MAKRQTETDEGHARPAGAEDAGARAAPRCRRSPIASRRSRSGTFRSSPVRSFPRCIGWSRTATSPASGARPRKDGARRYYRISAAGRGSSAPRRRTGRASCSHGPGPGGGVTPCALWHAPGQRLAHAVPQGAPRARAGRGAARGTRGRWRDRHRRRGLIRDAACAPRALRARTASSSIKEAGARRPHRRAARSAAPDVALCLAGSAARRPVFSGHRRA